MPSIFSMSSISAFPFTGTLLWWACWGREGISACLLYFSLLPQLSCYNGAVQDSLPLFTASPFFQLSCCGRMLETGMEVGILLSLPPQCPPCQICWKREVKACQHTSILCLPFPPLLACCFHQLVSLPSRGLNLTDGLGRTCFLTLTPLPMGVIDTNIFGNTRCLTNPGIILELEKEHFFFLHNSSCVTLAA